MALRNGGVKVLRIMKQPLAGKARKAVRPNRNVH
jgi:hypothetical protein